MWIFSAIGFFSVVTHPERPEAVLIRARVREDLEALRWHHLPDLEIEVDVLGDYRFRACVARDEWEHAAQGMAAELDYPNFREAVAQRQGRERAARYLEVWRAMHRLQSAASGNGSRSPAVD